MAIEPTKRRHFSKARRREIYQKCSGHCAYCGKPIPLESMQVDHIQPLALGGSNEIDNLLPACHSCNHYKDTLTLEKFRQSIDDWPGVLTRNNPTFRNAVRFGVIRIQQSPVLFYFEKSEAENGN